MSRNRRFLKGWISSILGIAVIILAVYVLTVSTLHLLVQLVILAGGFGIGGWLLGMDDTLIESFLNIHKFDKDSTDDGDES